MPAPTHDDSDGPPAASRCADLELESGELVIYDTRNHNAWIQSDGAVALTAVC